MDAARETTAVSFDELTQMVEKQLDRSYQPTIAARQKLLDLIGELRALHGTATSTNLLTDKGWQIARITVQGFGGISNADVPLVLDLATGQRSPLCGATTVPGRQAWSLHWRSHSGSARATPASSPLMSSGAPSRSATVWLKARSTCILFAMPTA